MKRQQSRKGWILLVLLVVGLIPSARGGASAIPTPNGLQIPATVQQAVEAAKSGGDEQVQLEVLLDSPQELDELKRMLRQLGGQVASVNGTYVQIQLPPDQVATAAQKLPAVGLGVEQTYSVPAVSAEQQAQQPVSGNLDELLRPSLEAMGALSFGQQQGVTGQGIKVAVIDTGIDPGHAALQKGPDGSRKVVDFRDFTPEGKVFTPQINRGQTYQTPEGRSFTLPSLPPGSRPHFGLWSEWGIGGEINRDLDRNGSQIDKFGVLVLDSKGDRRYDQVWVDSNNNGDFRDDGGPLTLFREGGKFGQLGKYRQRTNFVVADLDPTGDYVSFGFDGHGHGTAVSGVLAGWTADGYQGAAPGAQIMALKAARSDGSAAWAEIRQAVQYAVDQGAQIINISLAGLATGTQTDAIEGLWLRQVSREKGVLIVLAAGNGGPGLSSGATIGSPSEVLSVGSYYSPAMWKRDFDLVVPTEGLHWSTAVGPRQDGAFVPSLVAPGGAPAPAPLWLQTRPYTTVSGTSIAAPHAAGAAALLLEASKRQGLTVTPDRLIRAMESSARALAGYDPFEQGYGLLQLSAAFAALATAPSHPPFLVQSSSGGEGLLSRGDGQAGARLSLTNQGGALERWTINEKQGWVSPALTSVTLPKGVERRLDLMITPSTQPGIYSTFLQFQRPGDSIPAFAVPVTYVQPSRFPTSNNRLQWSGALPVARSQRQFVQVDPGMASLQFNVRLGHGANPVPEGSMQVQIYRPDGRIAYNSGILGGPNGVGLAGQFLTEHPLPGVWEVVVTALPDKVGAYSQVGWSVDARAGGGPIRVEDLHWNLEPGRTTAELTVTNAYASNLVRLDGIGLSRINLDQPWRSETHLNQIDVFDLPQTAAALRVEVANPYPANIDLDIKLWRNGVPVGESITRESSSEVIELHDLPPGRYSVTVGADGSAPPYLFYQYRRLVALQEYDLEVADSADHHLRGERWSVPIFFYTPKQPGRYVGHLMLRDEQSGQSLNWTTIEVSVGQPKLRVDPLFAPLVQGRSGQVVLELRNEKGALVDGAVQVNGRRYESRSGQVVVAVTPTSTSLTLVVEADLKEYQYLRQEIRLPVSETIQNWSIGTAANQENTAWWRKYQSELP